MADLTLMNEAGSIDLTFETASDLSALQYHFVKLNTSEQIVACGANEAPMGILQNAPNGSSATTLATVRVAGISKLKINETVEFGDRLTSTSGSLGEVVDNAGEEIGARALTSGNQNDLIRVQLMYGKAVSSDA